MAVQGLSNQGGDVERSDAQCLQTLKYSCICSGWYFLLHCSIGHVRDNDKVVLVMEQCGMFRCQTGRRHSLQVHTFDSRLSRANAVPSLRTSSF